MEELEGTMETNYFQKTLIDIRAIDSRKDIKTLGVIVSLNI